MIVILLYFNTSIMNIFLDKHWSIIGPFQHGCVNQNHFLFGAWRARLILKHTAVSFIILNLKKLYVNMFCISITFNNLIRAYFQIRNTIFQSKQAQHKLKTCITYWKDGFNWIFKDYWSAKSITYLIWYKRY